MATGPGKYNSVAEKAFKATQAEGLVLLVVNGKLGQGFEVLGSERVIAALPQLLRDMADGIEADHG